MRKALFLVVIFAPTDLWVRLADFVLSPVHKLFDWHDWFLLICCLLTVKFSRVSVFDGI